MEMSTQINILKVRVHCMYQLLQHTQSLQFCPHSALKLCDMSFRTNSDYFPNNIIRLVSETKKQ
jgi:hypothetical protein